MVNVYITYDDGKFIECTHVTEIMYYGTSCTTTISGDELLSTMFPVGKTLWLKTSAGIDCVHGENIRLIRITKE